MLPDRLVHGARGSSYLLRGRERECARLLDVLDQARRGLSAALIILGEPGMGKTAMLEYAAGAASGVRILSAAAAPSEAALPFACLHRLVGGVTGYAEEIPK